jgi:hypothetical protein
MNLYKKIETQIVLDSLSSDCVLSKFTLSLPNPVHFRFERPNCTNHAKKRLVVELRRKDYEDIVLDIVSPVK